MKKEYTKKQIEVMADLIQEMASTLAYQDMLTEFEESWLERAENSGVVESYDIDD